MPLHPASPSFVVGVFQSSRYASEYVHNIFEKNEPISFYISEFSVIYACIFWNQTFFK